MSPCHQQSEMTLRAVALVGMFDAKTYPELTTCAERGLPPQPAKRTTQYDNVCSTQLCQAWTDLARRSLDGSYDLEISVTGVLKPVNLDFFGGIPSSLQDCIFLFRYSIRRDRHLCIYGGSSSFSSTMNLVRYHTSLFRPLTRTR